MTRSLRVGIVGAGNVALGDHVPFYRSRPDLYELVAVADPAPERRALTGLPDDALHATPEALLARDDLDVVDVCTPQHVRRPIVLAALERGRHVISEKPLATTPADAAALVEAARAASVQLAVMHNYLFLPEFAATLAAIRAGAIGEVEVAIVNMLGVLDLPGNAAYAPRWRHDPAMAGGGVLMDMLHAVYVAEALVGRPIQQVSGWTHARSPDARVEDIALCRLEADGAAALVNVGWGVGPGGVDVAGRDGRINIRYRHGGTGPFEPVESVTLATNGDEPRPLALPPVDDFGVGGVLIDLAEAIAGGREPIASGAQGLHVLEATLAVYASAARQRPVRLPLDRADPLWERGALTLAEAP